MQSQGNTDAKSKLNQVLTNNLSNISSELVTAGKYDQAGTIMMACVVLQPNNANWHVGFAMCESFLGRSESARGELEMALSLDPEHTAALHLLGNICRKNGELERAVRLFEEDIKVHDRNRFEFDRQLISDLCESYIQNGTPEKARDLIHRYIQDSPHDEDLLHIRDKLNLR